MNGTTGTITLEKFTSSVIMQFNFSNYNIVSEVIKKISKARQEKQVAREKKTIGIQAISRTPNVSLLLFVKQLEETGYKLVDTIYEKRHGNTNGKDHMVKFVFYRQEYANPSKNFQKDMETVYFELNQMCQQALWQTRGYINPFYKKGKEKNFISINMDVRNPIILPDGKLIKKWQKDDKGKKIGKGPLPLFPDFFLSVKGGEIRLEKISKDRLKRFLQNKGLL